MFWDQLVAGIYAVQIRSENRQVNSILRKLVDGRPLLGRANDSSWAYYTYLLNDEARRLYEFISAEPNFDVESALV